MKTILLEPTDVLFFRDAIPMSAGQGKGAGARMPFPSTLHEAFRASLLLSRNECVNVKKSGRPSNAPRHGVWQSTANSEDQRWIATTAFRSLHTIGPFPWQPQSGLLLPVPLDVAFDEKHERLARLKLWRDDSVKFGEATSPGNFRPLCLPVAVTPPDKHGQLHGWWTLCQWQAYLKGVTDNANNFLRPVPQTDLWESEHRIGVEIEPGSLASKSGQLYAGSYLRADARTRFAAQIHLQKPANGEDESLDQLQWLLLGGERRLARIHHNHFDDPFTRFPPCPEPPGDGTCLLKWALVTPAIFVHGNLPGWCVDTKVDRAGGCRPIGFVNLDKSERKTGLTTLPGRALLVSWNTGKPLTVSGWDVVDQRAKPTMLAVPAGSVYYFLCENAVTARAIAARLHWQPRSDFYGEKGCGYGLVSFDVQMYRTSADVSTLAKELFNP